MRLLCVPGEPIPPFGHFAEKGFIETDYLDLGARILAETALGRRLGFDVDRNELAASSIAARIAPKHTQVWPTFQAVITHATLNRCAYQFEVEVRVSLE